MLYQGLSAPDDLAAVPDGSLYISDVTDGTLERLRPDGRLDVLLRGLQEPEGIVVLPDGSLLIAEQGNNRVLRYVPETGALETWLALVNQTGLAGVDGLALDMRAGISPTLVIPDSPNGTILRVGLADRTPAVIARDFARPTGAWVEADGSILVTDENAGALIRVRPDGTVVTLARLPIPDDVVEDDAGNIFVNTLGDGAVHMLAAGTYQDVVLVRDLASPQGLALDRDGNLVVTDPGHHRLVRLVLH